MLQIRIEACALFTLMLVIVFTGTATAGLRIVTESEITEKNKTRKETEIVTVDNGRARFEFLRGSAERSEKTPYLLTVDGGESWILGDVRKGEFYCATFNISEYFRDVGKMLIRVEGWVNPTIERLQVEKLLEEPGPEMLGHATTHVRLQIVAKATASVLLKKFEYSIKIVDDAWYAPDLEIHPIEERWMDALTQSGYGRLDEMFIEWSRHLQGSLMKLDSVVEVTNRKTGETSVSNESHHVVSRETLEAGEIDEKLFAVPECKALTKKQFKRVTTDMFKEGKLTR